FTYQSLSQSRFDDFKRAVDLLKDTAVDSTKRRVPLPGEKPSWAAGELEELKKIVARMDTLLTRESRRALSGNKDEIKKYLREAFIIRHFGQDTETYYRFKITDDLQLRSAINFLTHRDAYAALLKPRAGKEQKREKTKK
ncbi:MAG: hypothetical protein JXA71_18405, partial [Chitinispirillaceae bacterium]|nr:hypothetical protein [Chitinispirillaceae bacterium]